MQTRFSGTASQAEGKQEDSTPEPPTSGAMWGSSRFYSMNFWTSCNSPAGRGYCTILPVPYCISIPPVNTVHPSIYDMYWYRTQLYLLFGFQRHLYYIWYS